LLPDNLNKNEINYRNITEHVISRQMVDFASGSVQHERLTVEKSDFSFEPPIARGPLGIIVFGSLSEEFLSPLKGGEPSVFENKNFQNLSGKTFSFTYLRSLSSSTPNPRHNWWRYRLAQFFFFLFIFNFVRTYWRRTLLRDSATSGVKRV
jgi:hypothetical protein